MKSQRGATLVIFIVVILAAMGFVAMRGIELLKMNEAKTRGEAAAEVIFELIESWSIRMDYQCLTGSMSAIGLADLSVSNVTANRMSEYYVVMSIPPNPNIQITIDHLNSTAREFALLRLNRMAAASRLAPLVSVREEGADVLKVIATRGTSAAETAVFGARSTTDAVYNSLILGGLTQYGMTGC